MATISRGDRFLLVGGLLLAALMGYALCRASLPRPSPPAADGRRGRRGGLYPAATTGRTSAGGSLPASVGSGPGGPGDRRGDGPEDPRYGRLVRFSWLRSGAWSRPGRRSAASSARIVPPVAVVGSTQHRPDRGPGRGAVGTPPATGRRARYCWSPGRPRSWSTAPRRDRRRSNCWTSGPAGHSGFARTTSRQADLVVRCVADQNAARGPRTGGAPGRPQRPVLGGPGFRFRRAVENRRPWRRSHGAHRRLSAPGPGGPGGGARPRGASRPRRSGRRRTGRRQRTSWVILPLPGRTAQGDDRGAGGPGPLGPRAGRGRLRVLCGDGIGLETLSAWPPAASCCRSGASRRPRSPGRARRRASRKPPRSRRRSSRR